MLGMFGAWGLSVCARLGPARSPWSRSRCVMYGAGRARLSPAHAAGPARGDVHPDLRHRRPLLLHPERGGGALHQRLPLHQRRACSPASAASTSRWAACASGCRCWWAGSSRWRLFLLLYLLIDRTDFGLALQATAEDRDAAMLVGIRPQRMYAVAWGLGTALVAIAGVILANFFSVYPQAGLSFTVLAYAIVALGGFGSILGTLLAALAGRRGAERDRGLPAARVQGRVRLRVLHPDRPVPAPGAIWPLLARRPAPAARSRWSGWSPPSWPCSTRSPSSAAARSTTRRWASWCCSTRCSASAGTSSAAGPASSTSARASSSRSAPTPPRSCPSISAGTPGSPCWAAVVVRWPICAALTYPVTRLRGHYFAIATVAMWMIAQPIGATWPLINGSQGLFIPVAAGGSFVHGMLTMEFPGRGKGLGFYYLSLAALRGHAAAAPARSSARSGASTSARCATTRTGPRPSASTAGSTR